MILIINICKEKLHYNEFVEPIEDIVKKNFQTLHYLQLTKGDLEKASKIIICGTSLNDNQFIKDIEMFQWIKEFKKPILGICGGMQIIQLVFNGKLKHKKEIGFYKENFTKEFLGIEGEQQVYHLHNNYVSLTNEFEDYTKSKIPQAIKHKTKPIYGTLFHPEVRNKDLILNFLSLNQ